MLEDGIPSGGAEAKYCSNCGRSLEPQAQFCPDCGTRREPPSTAPAPRPAEAGFTPPPSDVPGRSIPDWGVPSIFGPMTLGDLLGGAFRIYAAAFLSIIILVALVEVPLTLLSTWIGSVMDQIFLEVTVRMQDAFEPDPLTGVVDPDLVLEILLGPFLEALRQAAPVLILLVLANWIGSMLLTGALICAISQRILGNPINVGNAYSFALGRILFMFGASFLVGLVVVLIALTIIGIPLAIYLAIRWSFALQIAALERRGPLQAIARSSELVSGSWWRVFGIMLLVGILVAIVGWIVGAILGFAPLAGSLIVAVFLAPILAIVQILLYHDLRVRRDTANRYTPETLAAELDRPSPSQVL